MVNAEVVAVPPDDLQAVITHPPHRHRDEGLRRQAAQGGQGFLAEEVGFPLAGSAGAGLAELRPRKVRLVAVLPKANHLRAHHQSLAQTEPVPHGGYDTVLDGRLPVRAVIVANAPFRFWPEAYAWAAQAELLLAADGGANHLARVGLRPHLVVGDLDSITPETRAWIGEARIVPRPDQDHTDLEKTLALAVERGATEALILAATGGRLDHALHNLGLLGRFGKSLACEIREEHQRIVPVHDRASFAVKPGATVSLMPLEPCSRVWAEGFHWPLFGEPLSLATRTSLSNRATAPRVEVRVEGGVCLVFLPC